MLASSTLFRIDWHFNFVRIDATSASLHTYIATRWQKSVQDHLRNSWKFCCPPKAEVTG